ncbi:hypothetical protein AVV40_gp26 [Mycobacterium phage Swirley]|uniref:Uncharacterized protein n=1 Tax=Mycobacterium phage Swirley TaxID=1527534 RepID=A0A076YMX9_9CAUD|nr:hypothetical protein AVV40_gp26 [Mycobacterium phage Swirley]AIK68933.1 hypothetical protein PBI_SWIRLEY_68 [Mycobacterium phage Swirley]
MARSSSPAVSIPRLFIHIPGRLFVATITTDEATKVLVHRSVGVDLFGPDYAPVSQYFSTHGFTQTEWALLEDQAYDGGTVEATVYIRTHDKLEGVA